jgi:enoyl-CoA hydratase/carnithine racemase
MTFQTIRYNIQDHIATVTLARTEKLNAFNTTMRHELLSVFDDIDADDHVRAVIVTGDGRAFCAGADLSAGATSFDIQQGNPVDGNGDVPRDGGGELTLRIFECLKPVIAAVNGAAVGVGATMILPMDIRIASVDSRFGFVFTRRGLVPEAASSWFLPRIVGISTALEWCYSGRLISAEEALDRQLIRSSHPPAELIPAARALAREIVENASPVSIAITRQLLWRMVGAEHPMEAHRIDSRAVFWRGRSPDVREGVGAFLEKRPANFPGKVSKDMPDFFPWWSDWPYHP